MKRIHIDEGQKKLIMNILKKYFVNEKYFVFGSRANGKKLKPFSDLDIAVLGVGPVNASKLNQAAEAFSASDLPFKVDLVDLNSISAEFRLNIEPDFIELV